MPPGLWAPQGRSQWPYSGAQAGHTTDYIVKWHGLTLLNSLVRSRPSNRLDRIGQNLNIHSDTIHSYKAGFKSVPNA